VTIDLQLIPGFKPHPVRDFVYVQGPTPQGFRDFMETLQKIPGVQGPTSGTARFLEQMLTTPDGEFYFAVALTSDKLGWRNLLQAHAQRDHMQLAEIEGTNLLIGGSKRVALEHCELQSTMGVPTL